MIRIRPAIAWPLALGTVGLAMGCVQGLFEPRRALFAYLAGFVVALTVALGALLGHDRAHGARALVRRLEALGERGRGDAPRLRAPLPADRVWGAVDTGAKGRGSRSTQRAWAAHAHAWLNVPFFLARAYVYLGVGSALAIALQRASVENDAHPREALVRRERFLSAAGLPVVAITMTAASFDWIMSLNAQWSSDMMGVYLFAGAFAGAVGATAVAAWLAWRAKLLPAAAGAAHFHALGRLLLVGVIFWAYIAFCQFVLVWIADLSRESSFYIDRGHGPWAWAAGALFLAHFALPFLLLLSREQKRIPSRLALAGGGLLLAHALDIYWLVLPPLHAGMQWLDLAFLIGVAGACVAFGVWRFLSAAAYPLRDPALAESLRYEAP